MRKGAKDLIKGQLGFKAGESPAPEWSGIEQLKGTDFPKIVKRYRNAHLEEARNKAVKEELKGDIQALVLVSGQKAVRVGDLQAILCHGSSAAKLDAGLLSTRLVEMGVDADTVAEAVEWATIPGNGYDYIQVVEDKSDV